jgi:uncharacterized protein (DUF488 family)
LNYLQRNIMFPHAIYTIGYGQRSPEELYLTLLQFDISWLIDVRSKPWSKWKPEFSRKPLETFLRDRGLEYTFMGDQLGGRPENPTLMFPGGNVNYKLLVQQDFFKAGLERLEQALDKGLRVCLMCAEQKPESCHRYGIIGRELDKRGIPVIHIDEHNKLLTQQEVLVRARQGQMDLFDEK